MDSQLTLVDSCDIISPRDNIVLTFNRYDMLHAVVHTLGDDRPSYTVNTVHDTTTVYAGDRLLATIRRRLLRRDQIIFPGSRSMDLNSWLKAPMLANFPLVFHVLDRRFEWRQNIDGQLVLYESCFPDDSVAWLSKGRYRRRGRRTAYLTIKPEMSEVQDMIVLSCMLAEHKLQVIAMKQAKVAIALLYVIPAYS